jgi:uncharacterized protein YciI
MAHFLAIYRPPRSTFAHDATEEESRIIGIHFQYLKKLLAEGTLLLAGPCEDASMGLAIFETASEAEARAIAAADPAVVGRVFTCEIKPYRLSLLRK